MLDLGPVVSHQGGNLVLFAGAPSDQDSSQRHHAHLGDCLTADCVQRDGKHSAAESLAV
jgi:hypothetical protein